MNGLKPIKIPSAKEKVASELRKAGVGRKERGKRDTQRRRRTEWK